MLLIRVLVNRFLVKFLGSQKFKCIFDCVGGFGSPNPCVVQESTVLNMHKI